MAFRKTIIACAILLIALGVSARIAWADGAGLTFFVQGSCPACTGITYIPGSAPDVYNLQNDPILSTSGSFSGSGSNGAVADFSGSISNGSLHGYSQINTGTSFDANSYVGMDAYFFDTFNITGPAGQSGQFKINLFFDGSGVTTGGAALGDYVNTYNLLENGTVIPGITYSGIISTLAIPYGASSTQLSTTVNLTLASGSSVVLGQLLQTRSVMQNEGSSGSLTIDDSDTGYFTVTPVTQSFGFSTASGLTYTTPTETPEPATAPWLLIVLLAGGGWFQKHRLSR